MNDAPETDSTVPDDALARLLAAALTHVPFDGWSAATFKAATADSGLSREEAAAAAPRGALDLAIAFHKQGDAAMRAEAAKLDLDAMRYSERVTRLVRLRLEAASTDREVVRRGVTLFALPFHAAEGAKLIWGTADAIWTTLGDTSEDYNWYSKRAILSGVYSSTLLFWLGDASDGAASTWEFLDRRIAGVMQFEKVKAKTRDSRLAKVLFAGPRAALSLVRAPGAMRASAPVGMPGRRAP